MRAENRLLPDWFNRVRSGQVRLPRFQRYEAWGPGEITSLLESVQESDSQFRGPIGLTTESPFSDNGVFRVGVDVQHRGVVHIDADGTHFPAKGQAKTLS